VIFNNYNYNSGNICPTVNVGGVSMSLLWSHLSPWA